MNQASLQRRRSSARLTGLAHIFHNTKLYIYIWAKPFHEYLTHEKSKDNCFYILDSLRGGLGLGLGLGFAVLGYFWCGVAVIFISKYGIAVFRIQSVCGEYKFYVAVVGENNRCVSMICFFFMTRGYKS